MNIFKASFLNLNVLFFTLNLLNIESVFSRNIKKNTTSLKFQSLQHNFGTVFRGKKVVNQFEFVNLGKYNVKILGIHSDCGCTLDGNYINQVYSQGQRGNIRISFDTTHFQGKLKKKILLSLSENSLQKMLPLYIKGIIKEELIVDPQVIIFDESDWITQNPQEGSIEFKYPKGRVLGFDYNPKLFKVTYPYKKNKNKFLINLIKKPDSPFEKRFIFLNNNSKNLPKAPILVLTNLYQNLKISPRYVDFGPVKFNKSSSKNLTLKGPNWKLIDKIEMDLFINEIKESNPEKYLSYTITKGSNGNSGIIRLKLINSFIRKGSLAGVLKLSSKKEKSLNFKIHLYGYFFR